MKNKRMEIAWIRKCCRFEWNESEKKNLCIIIKFGLMNTTNTSSFSSSSSYFIQLEDDSQEVKMKNKEEDVRVKSFFNTHTNHF